jgi:hypothetical protein
MDLYRITHPLRLAKGSHRPGSGTGCAMNVISYINGDEQITDFPMCSARPLSLLVQACNDLLAGPNGYLLPDNSVLALELAWQTVGTADVPDTVVHAWLAALLSSPTWGVVRYAKISAIKAIVDIAELHRAVASGNVPTIGDWDAADRAAFATDARFETAGLSAVRAAYESTGFVDTDLRLRVDRVVANALRAHSRASGGTTASRIVEFTRHAIGSWRDLAGLDNIGEISAGPLDRASQLVGSAAAKTG